MKGVLELSGGTPNTFAVGAPVVREYFRLSVVPPDLAKAVWMKLRDEDWQLAFRDVTFYVEYGVQSDDYVVHVYLWRHA